MSSAGAWLIGLLAAVGIGVWIGRRAVRRTRTQREAMAGELGALTRRIQELESERNQASAILESMVEGVCALDGTGRVLWLNPSAQQLLGAGPTQSPRPLLTDLFRQPELDALITDVLQHRRPAACEVRAFTPSERMIRFQAAPCEGGEAALVLVAQDVTEMRRLEGLRREFVGNVSHELKTPLTSIQGLVETLLGGALEDPAHNRRFVTLIEEDAKRLARLIDDLLELSQIESKAIPLQVKPVDVRTLLAELAERFRQPAQERQVSLDVALAADTPRVPADPERLRQVFVNLLDNAIKFNAPGGRVTVSAERRDGVLRVAIQDTGIGIPPADLPRIFERFYRVDKARSRQMGGTGLGLSIVKHLVELHRGTVEVESRPGRGSVFTVCLPLGPATLTVS